jgi:hypothetical protein
MRAREFLPETTTGVLGKRRRSATRGLNIFSDADRWNSDYTLNRVMMAVASTDGITPPKVDKDSWVGKSKSAHPYTQEEQDMLTLAYRAVGAQHRDLNHGDLDSEEMDTVNKVSPVRAFHGYPR